MDLRNNGLVRNLGGLGVLIDQYEQSSDLEDAEIGMDAETPATEDRHDFSLVGVPIPIIHKGFRIPVRQLQASRRNGTAIDTMHVATATRKVAEAAEGLLMNGSSLTVGSASIYGYTSHPNRITGSAAGDWGTKANIFPTVVSMIADLEAAGFYGPFALYANGAQYAETLAAEGTDSFRTVRERITALEQIQVFSPTFKLAAGALVMVQLTSDVVDLAVAQDVRPINWNSGSGMTLYGKVLGAMAPRVKDDYTGACGVCHYTGA